MKTTSKELTMLTAIRDDQYHDGRNVVDNGVWTWSVMDSAGLGNGAGGVVASLVKKGLVGVREDGEDSTIWLTAAGAEVVA